MTITQIKKEITTLQTENAKVEQTLNILHNDKQTTQEKIRNIERDITLKERRNNEIKKSVFELTIQLNKQIDEQKRKERKQAIQERLKHQPTFDDVVQKELNAITFDELWRKYKDIAEEQNITRASVVRQESIKNYTNLLTNLIEKELDGGTIDLIEKRNLKLPIQNFLSNPFIKSELQL
jgi:chromosome segregation ATPase